MTKIRSALVATGLLLVLAMPAAASRFPATLPLPNGFQPEGITIGRGTTFYVGSIPTGAVYRGDLRTGSGALLVQPQAGRSSIGLDYDRGRIFVAGGATGNAFVYDAKTGATLATYHLATTTPTFVNDVVVTKDAAWFTESSRAVLYRVALGKNGALPSQSGVTQVPLTGDFQLAEGFNANGIDATRNGRTLVIVQSNLGRLYTVDAHTGRATRIALTGGDVVAGDGILLDGRTLYVVQNQLNRIAVIALDSQLATGQILHLLTNPALDVPTTIDKLGNRLYAVNARFGVPNPERAIYAVVQIPLVTSPGKTFTTIAAAP